MTRAPCRAVTAATPCVAERPWQVDADDQLPIALQSIERRKRPIHASTPVGSTSRTSLINMARLSAENLRALNGQELDFLPKEQRRDAMLKLAQMKIAAKEDASQLLSQLQTEMETSSAGRPGTGQRPPPTAGSERPSIAGSLGGRITDSMLAYKMRERSRTSSAIAQPPRSRIQGASNFVDLSDAASRPGTASSKVEQFFQRHEQQQARPGTAASQRSEISVAASQRSQRSTGSRPPTAARAAAERAAALAKGPELLPPIIDYKELLPEHIVNSFREEFRAKKKAAEEAEREAAAEAEYLASRSDFAVAADRAELEAELTAAPLNEVTNRPVTTASSARPLTGHSEISMSKPAGSDALPVPTAWAKKGKKPIPRAALSSVGACLTWD